MTPDRADAGLLSELADTGPFSNHRMLNYFPHTCSSCTGVVGAIKVEQLRDVRDAIACAVQHHIARRCCRLYQLNKPTPPIAPTTRLAPSSNTAPTPASTTCRTAAPSAEVALAVPLPPAPEVAFREALGRATLDTDALAGKTTSSPAPVSVGAGAGSEVEGGTHTDVVIVVGSPPSSHDVVVAICTQFCGAVRSDALGAFPSCHDSGSYIDLIVLNICRERSNSTTGRTPRNEGVSCPLPGLTLMM